jgi:hypothetical protein
MTVTGWISMENCTRGLWVEIVTLRMLFLGDGIIPPPVVECGGDPPGAAVDGRAFEPCGR